MKKALPVSALLAMTLLLISIWNRSKEDPIDKPELIVAIDKINKKIPAKILKKKTPHPKPIEIISPRKQSPDEDEIAVHLQGANGDLIITSVTIVDDLIIAHGDIIVGQISNMDDFIERSENGGPLILPAPKLWDEAIIPYVIDADLSNATEVKLAITTMNKKTNVTWKLRGNEKDFVRFKTGKLHCYSPLGRLGGEQKISLSPSCMKGAIMHEMIHTMGLLHEQNREDRDEYITILWENIDSKNHLQFQKIFNKLIDVTHFKFDYKSIMLYKQDAFSKYSGDLSIVRVDGDTYYPSKNSLSSGDLKKLSVLYPK